MQNAHRRAAMGTSLKHSGHFFVVGSDGGSPRARRAAMAFTGTTTKKYTAAEIRTNESNALMKSPIRNWLPFTVKVIAEKSGCPTTRGDQRSEQVLDHRRDHGAERAADDDGDRQVDDVAAQEELTEALSMSFSSGVHRCLIKVPFRSSATACCSCSSVFMTIGPYHATGSSIGFPDTSRNRMPSSPACTTTSSPLSKSTSERFPVSSRFTASLPSTCSVRTPRGCGGVAERARAREDVRERVPGGVHRQPFALARRDRHIDVSRIGRHAFHGPSLPPEVSHDHPHPRPVVVHDLGYGLRRNVLIPGRGHFQRRRQIRPELEAVHPALRVALRHFLVHDAASRRHPLHVARAEAAAVAEAVAVFDVSRQHVGDGFDPPVRMPRKAGEIIVRVLVAEVVEQQERIELRRVAEAERALQLDAGAFEVRARALHSFDGSNGHGGVSLESVSGERAVQV